MSSRVDKCSAASTIGRTVQDVPTLAARRALTPRGWLEHCELTIDERGLISDVGPATGVTPAVTLVPGFVDVQVNGIDDIDVASARGDDWRRLGDLLLDQGVTSWCPTLVTMAKERFASPLQRMAE